MPGSGAFVVSEPDQDGAEASCQDQCLWRGDPPPDRFSPSPLGHANQRGARPMVCRPEVGGITSRPCSHPQIGAKGGWSQAKSDRKPGKNVAPQYGRATAPFPPFFQPVCPKWPSGDRGRESGRLGNALWRGADKSRPPSGRGGAGNGGLVVSERPRTGLGIPGSGVQEGADTADQSLQAMQVGGCSDR